MIDGNSKATLNLKATALDVAGSEDNMTYDDFSKVYYVKASVDTLKLKDFTFFQETSKGNPVYRKQNILAELDILAGGDNIFMYKNSNSKWREEE